MLVLACQTVSVVPAEEGVVREALVHSLADGPLDLAESDTISVEGFTVRPVRFNLRPGFAISGALWVPEKASKTGVLVAHGHYGQGKSSPEAQEISHRLAAQGHLVLAVDTPGVEEWDVQGRQIHFDEGAHNRAFLAAGGSSAMALQLAVLRRGVDVLEQMGATRIAAAGASGGAVQALYLQLTDDRVVASALASPPRVPREARAGGCACDQIPGWPGPDPHLLAAVQGPVLWMSEVKQERPAGLPPAAEFVVMEGPHSFTAAMQRRALAFIERALDGAGGSFLKTTPQLDLSTGPLPAQWSQIIDLPLPAPVARIPQPSDAVAHTQECTGSGPTVVAGGTDAADVAAMVAQGLRVCRVSLMTASGVDWDPVDLAESIALGKPLIDRVAGALHTAAVREKAVGVWGSRGYGLAAAGVGLPFVVRDPLTTIHQVDPKTDAPWVHFPGAWWGGVGEILGKAVAVDHDRSVLAKALLDGVQ